jgi:hypothetical protein
MALLATLAGCEKGRRNSTPVSWIYRRSFAMVFSETKNIELEGAFHKNRAIIYCPVYFDESFSYRYDDTGAKKEIYDSFCEKYGDMTYNRGDYVYLSESHTFQMYSFVSVDIVSDADFDQAHPKGTSLADLIIFQATSSKPFVDSGYKMYESVWEVDGRTYTHPYYPIHKRVSELTAYDFMMLYGIGYHSETWLNFEALPTLSKEHIFTVTFTDERGETFSDSVKMTFE